MYKSVRKRGFGSSLESTKIFVCLFVGWLLNVPAACECISGRICSDNWTCCHTEIEVADPTFYLTQSQFIDTGPTSPSADAITPGAWQGSHWSANFLSHWYDSTPAQSGFEPEVFRSRGGRLYHQANEALVGREQAVSAVLLGPVFIACLLSVCSIHADFSLVSSYRNRLVGLVVRRPPRERKIPGSNPDCAGFFFGVESYQ